MAKVTKIDVLSSARQLGTMMALIGLAAGVIYSFGGLLIDALVTTGWVTSSETPGLSFGTVLAFGALIGMPIIFAIPGLLVGAVIAFLFNVAARWIGGVEVDLER